ncbi:MAG: NAD-dependent epimerase/dehydratase family protein [Nevskiaceae bacterium]|nr:MAG: NAD-dependent epimerase/dehydratase family protein [Nevskiaceae bacterium]TBR72619.1 MAG: NAD-dependent epimerase/dehydratase family protein [Nevskiaceae bacterium]
MAQRKPGTGGARKTVLVTGAGGSLAQRVIARLHPHHNVVAADFRRRVETDADIPSYLVQLYKRTFEDVFAAHKIDAVIHIGRMFPHERNRAQRYNANVMGTRRLFDLCRKYQVGQVIVHSTYFVYGATAWNPALIDEDAPLKASEVTQDLVDSVELESLANIQLWRHPELHVTVLRPCNVLGPDVRNSLSILLSNRFAPVLLGFAPLMQFVHVDDMAEAIVLAFEKNHPGIYNVAPADYIPYPDAVRECGCHRVPVLSVPPLLPRAISRVLNSNVFFPPYLINYFKYPVILDGRLFGKTFGWKPRHTLNDIFASYRRQKQRAAG